MKKIVLSISMIASLLLAGQNAMAEGSVRHSGQALTHSVQASAHSVGAAAKLTSAAVALPLVAVGAVGHVSGEAGKALLEEANSDFNTPLTVSDETVTAGPAPDQAVYQ